MKVAAVIAAVILAAFGLASFSVLDSRDKAREQRAADRAQRIEFCGEIENLKAAQRAQARQNYARLDETLKLLHVKKTPRVVRVARRNRDEELRRFAAKPCQ